MEIRQLLGEDLCFSWFIGVSRPVAVLVKGGGSIAFSDFWRQSHATNAHLGTGI